MPFNSEEAMICTFECTFCSTCVEEILLQVCSNCGGNFTKRPIRPEEQLEKYPVSQKVVYKQVNVESHLKRIQEK